MSEKKYPTFGRFVCVGDGVQWSEGGFDFTARLEYDDVTSLKDFECYSEEDEKLWHEGSWSFIGVVVSVKRNGIEVDDFADSLWGMECNLTEDHAHLTDWIDHESLVNQAELRRQELIERLK